MLKYGSKLPQLHAYQIFFLAYYGLKIIFLTLVSVNNDDEYTRHTLCWSSGYYGLRRTSLLVTSILVPHTAHYNSHAQYGKRVYSQTLLVNQMSLCTILPNEKDVSVFKRHSFVKIILFQQRYHQANMHVVRFSWIFYSFVTNTFIPISHSNWYFSSDYRQWLAVTLLKRLVWHLWMMKTLKKLNQPTLWMTVLAILLLCLK